MRKTFAISLAALALAGCTNPDGAREVLLDAGYTNVTTEGYDPWGCGKDDDLATKFRATGPTGRPVQGVVCEGLFLKNSTIRIQRR